MNNDEFYTYEDRAYIQPTLSSGEQEAFISNLRDTQKQNTAQIAQQTYNLGTDVPSNLGGLGGGEAYFTSRYQTPQVNEMADTLKTAAQAQALSDIMSNYQSQLKNKYNQAYRNYSKRARAASNTGTNKTSGSKKGDIEITDSGKTGKTGITTVPISGHDTSAFTIGGDTVMYDENTGDYWVNGVNRGKNPSVVSFKTPAKGAGGGGGGVWGGKESTGSW